MQLMVSETYQHVGAESRIYCEEKWLRFRLWTQMYCTWWFRSVALVILSPAWNVNNMLAVQFGTGIPWSQSMSHCYQCLSKPGNSKIMYCGILFDMPCCVAWILLQLQYDNFLPNGNKSTLSHVKPGSTCIFIQMYAKHPKTSCQS